MPKTAKCYIFLISAAGLGITVLSLYNLITDRLKNAENLGNELSFMIIMTVMCIICSSLPVVMSNRQSLDMSYVCILSTLLLKGPSEAVVVAVLGMLLAISKQVRKERDGTVVQVKYCHVFNTPIYQTLFNMGNLAISIFLPGLLFKVIYESMGYSQGVMKLPEILLPMFVFLLLTLICNYILLIILFILNGIMQPRDAFAATFGEILPNLACIAPIGLLFSYILNFESGQYLVLLFIFPLILARYTFNLYLESKNQYYKMVKTLIVTLEAKDKYTKGHSQRVELYAEEICGTMRMSMAKTETVKIAALLHDIGKIGIGENILSKPGKLSPEEFDTIKTHPAIGAKILTEINVDERIIKTMLYHHRWYNGGGYPVPQEDEEVPDESYILGVADAYDAMTSDRPYRKGYDPQTALDIIRDSMGTQFHPEIAKAFIELKTAQLAHEAQEQLAGGADAGERIGSSVVHTGEM